MPKGHFTSFMYCCGLRFANESLTPVQYENAFLLLSLKSTFGCFRSTFTRYLIREPREQGFHTRVRCPFAEEVSTLTADNFNISLVGCVYTFYAMSILIISTAKTAQQAN